MTAVLDILDRRPADADEQARWSAELESSLVHDAEAWVSAVGEPGSEDLSRDRSWTLLSWVELRAPDVFNERRADLVATLAFAMALLAASPIDRREVRVVASLVRRSAELADVSYVEHVRVGCARAGALGRSRLEWLSGASASTPTSHQEVLDGSVLMFRRAERDIDLDKLQRWFHGEK